LAGTKTPPTVGTAGTFPISPRFGCGKKKGRGRVKPRWPKSWPEKDSGTPPLLRGGPFYGGGPALVKGFLVGLGGAGLRPKGHCFGGWPANPGTLGRRQGRVTRPGGPRRRDGIGCFHIFPGHSRSPEATGEARVGGNSRKKDLPRAGFLRWPFIWKRLPGRRGGEFVRLGGGVRFGGWCWRGRPEMLWGRWGGTVGPGAAYWPWTGRGVIGRSATGGGQGAKGPVGKGGKWKFLGWLCADFNTRVGFRGGIMGRDGKGGWGRGLTRGGAPQKSWCGLTRAGPPRVSKREILWGHGKNGGFLLAQRWFVLLCVGRVVLGDSWGGRAGTRRGAGRARCAG